MTDEKQVEDLEKRIDELESMVRSMLPSRRDALKLGVAGVAGASIMSGTASAGSSQVGTIGTSTNRVDINAEDIDASDTVSTTKMSVSGKVTSNLDLDSNAISNLATLNGDNLVTSGESTDYEVQKDGSDTSGVINFKTS